MLTREQEDAIFDKIVQMRADQEASYCKLCKGGGFDLTNPLICKNCMGTGKRGKGNCHKCTLNQVATGYVYRMCPVCMPQERVEAILDTNDCVDRDASPAVSSRHEHGILDVQCKDLRVTVPVLRETSAADALADFAKSLQP